MIEVDWVKSTSHKKAYKHEVLIKISQKVRFEKNYIVWKHRQKISGAFNLSS
jgi:hypothetical protein